jgi:hypothetical protein
MISSFRVLLVPRAGNHRQARVFGEAGIAARQLAEKKERATAGFYSAGVDTVRAKARALLPRSDFSFICHEHRIT